MGDSFIAIVKESNFDLYHWLHALCEYTVRIGDSEDNGSLKYKDSIYDFKVLYDKCRQDFTLIVYGTHDKQFILYLKRVLYKCTYCVQCEKSRNTW